MAEIYRSTTAFAYTDKDGATRIVTPGMLVSGSDPGYKGRENLFEPVDVAVDKAEARRSGRVEDASAEPNAKRSVSTAHPKAEPKSEPKPEPKTESPKPGARRGPTKVEK